MAVCLGGVVAPPTSASTLSVVQVPNEIQLVTTTETGTVEQLLDEIPHVIDWAYWNQVLLGGDIAVNSMRQADLIHELMQVNRRPKKPRKQDRIIFTSYRTNTAQLGRQHEDLKDTEATSIGARIMIPRGRHQVTLLLRSHPAEFQVTAIMDDGEQLERPVRTQVYDHQSQLAANPQTSDHPRFTMTFDVNTDEQQAMVIVVKRIDRQLVAMGPDNLDWVGIVVHRPEDSEPSGTLTGAGGDSSARIAYSSGDLITGPSLSPQLAFVVVPTISPLTTPVGGGLAPILPTFTLAQQQLPLTPVVGGDGQFRFLTGTFLNQNLQQRPTDSLTPPIPPTTSTVPEPSSMLLTCFMAGACCGCWRQSTRR